MGRARGWRLAALVLLGVGLAALGVESVRHGGDFLAFFDAGEAALRRGDVYAAGPRMRMNVFYAPTFSLLMAPLALLPPAAAGWIWYLLKLAALAWVAHWIAGAVRREAPAIGRREAAACALLPFLVAFNPVMSEFRLGQANWLVLLFTILTVRALERGHPLRAALLFSLAAVKITPLALLPWLLLRRQWRFFLALGAVAAGWLAALAAWWGPARVPGLFAEWIQVTARLKAVPGKISFFENQSLQGVAYRLAGQLPWLEARALGLPLRDWLWLLPCLALVALLAVVAARDRFRARLPPEEFALVSLLMLLASSDSRWAHHVQLLVPLAVLAALAARTGLLRAAPRLGAWLAGGEAAPPPAAGARLRRTLAWLLGAGLLALVVTGRDVVGPSVNHALRALGLHTAFDLALVAFLAARLLRRGPPPPAEAPVWSLASAPVGSLAGAPGAPARTWV